MKAVIYPVILGISLLGLLLRNQVPLQKQREQEKSRRAITDSDKQLVDNLRQRMKPSDLLCSESSCPNKQFFHLHHMKSGGTSVDSWIGCSKSRLSSSRNMTQIPSYSLHECSGQYFHDCINNSNHTCRSRIASSTVMSYCAPLFTPNMMGWQEARAITMLRHPVDRVWSMYRFTTKGCYACKSLKEVYELIDSGQTEDMHGVCAPQLLNHMTRNFMTNDDPELSPDAQIKDALYNLKNRFTVVMVLERLQESIDLVEYAFPWMAKRIPNSDMVCEFPHANSSPQNNHCGPNNTHLSIPSQPDEETRQLIIKHNQWDIQLYEEGLKYFELQLEAAGDVDEDVE